MKKIVSIVVLVAILVVAASTVVNATTNSELADKLYQIGSKYGLTSGDKVKIERYLSDYPVTNEQADKLVEKANQAAGIMDAAGKTNISQLSKADKDALKAIANEAADIVDVQLTFNKSSVTIKKNGKVIETIKSENGKLTYTGNETNVVLVVSSVVAVALVATVVVVARKKIANV